MGKYFSLLIIALFFFLMPGKVLAQDYLGGTVPNVNTIPANHPYLFFSSQQEIDTLRTKAQNEPYKSWYGSFHGSALNFADIVIRDEANGKYAPGQTPTYSPTDVWWSNILFSYAGLSYKLSINTAEQAKLMSAIKIFIKYMPVFDHASQGGPNAIFCTAVVYDLMGNELTEIIPGTTISYKTKLETFIKQSTDAGLHWLHYGNWSTSKNNWDYWPIRFNSSNHIHRFATEVLIAGIVLKNQNFLNEGLNHLYLVFKASLTSDGVFDHGDEYLEYATLDFIPTALIYKRLFNINLFALDDPPLKNMFEVLIKERRPDGWNPNFEDSTFMVLDHRLFAQFTPDPPFHLWHTNDGQNVTRVKPHFLFLFSDNSILKQAPTWNPTQFLMGQNYAVFRRDWSPNSSWMLLQGQIKPTLEGHNHHDQLNFTVFAHGASMVIDSGYANYGKTHDDPPTDNCEIPINLVSAKAHNVILADGTGPVNGLGQYTCPYTDYNRGACNDWTWWTDNNVYPANSLGLDKANLSNYFSTNELDQAVVNIKYSFKDWSAKGVYTGNCSFGRDQISDPSIKRTVIYPKSLGINNEYFIVIDDIKAERSHTYDWILHGGSTRISGTGNERKWRMETFDKLINSAAGFKNDGDDSNDRELTIHINATASLNLSQFSALHYLSQSKQYAHTAIKATSTAQNMQYISLLYPRKVTGMSSPSITDLLGSNGAVGLDLQVIQSGVTVHDQVYTKNTTGETTIGHLKSNGTNVYSHEENNSLKMVTMNYGTSLTFNNKPLISSTNQLNYAFLNYNAAAAQLTGKINLVSAASVSFYTPGGTLITTQNYPGGETNISLTYNTTSPSLTPTCPLKSLGDFNCDGKINESD
ncbi:heparinase II/III family protein, partial [Candidatus Microgenomates bacterium]|nr:heparinase II/III family protein [Candidatus Microgenomates bacterium]